MLPYAYKCLRARPARGRANSEPPSEHPSDGVSYVVEVTLVEGANLTNEAFRVYHAHL